MNNNSSISIIQPDDWHIHLRENNTLGAVVDYTSKKFSRCIAMPNLTKPIVNSKMAREYKKEIKNISSYKDFEPFIPCYLAEDIDLKDFSEGIKNNFFFGAKLYPVNSTNNSSMGISRLEKIFPLLEILENLNAPLLIHGEKINSNISIFDREKYFIDEDLKQILNRFKSLKIVLEHVSTEYGANFINESNNNVSATITLHHLLLTKKDVFNTETNPHHFCMPVVKNETDLITLRKYACSGNKKFFLGTDSAPHEIKYKKNNDQIKPGIFTSPIAIEMYTSIFEEENSLHNLEKFTSINGANFYDLPLNKNRIRLNKEQWTNSEFTIYKNIKIKNFMGGQKIKWKVVI